MKISHVAMGDGDEGFRHQDARFAHIVIITKGWTVLPEVPSQSTKSFKRHRKRLVYQHAIRLG